jgi:hypothetical protein
MTEFNNGKNKIKIDPQQSVSVCVLASIYIASQIVKNIEINSNVISGKNLTMLENETKEIVGVEPVKNSKGEPIIEANGTQKMQIKNEGILLNNQKLKNFIQKNLKGYICGKEDQQLFFSGLNITQIQQGETYNVFLTRHLKIKLDEFEQNELYKNTYIFHFIVHSFCMALLKHNNKYYYINSHSDSLSSERKGIICEYDTLDNFFIEFTISTVLNSLTAVANIIFSNISLGSKEGYQVDSLNIEYSIYYSTFEKYKNDMTEYIIKQKYTVYDDSKLTLDKISSDNNIFKDQFKDWCLYDDGAGKGNDCLIISFLKCTIPIFSKIDQESRYNTASHFRRNMLLDDKLPYKNLFTKGEIDGEIVDGRYQNGFTGSNVLSEDIVVHLCKYFIINVLFISLNKINKQGDMINQFYPIRGSQTDKEPIDLLTIGGNYYVINNKGDGHFDSISNNNKSIFEIKWDDICYITDPLGESILLDLVSPKSLINNTEQDFAQCDFNNGERVLYNNNIYMIYDRNYTEPEYITNNRKCISVNIFKVTNEIDNVKKFNKLRLSIKVPNAVLKNELINLITETLNNIPIEQIKKYVNNRPKQLFEQMEQLERKITDPRLKLYQNYLIEQHNKFFNIPP